MAGVGGGGGCRVACTFSDSDTGVHVTSACMWYRRYIGTLGFQSKIQY